MIVGSFGDCVFEVSQSTVKTLDNVTWNSEAKYAEIDRYLKDDLIEFQGCSLETITFTVQLNAIFGYDPLQEYVKFLKAMREGKAQRFVIGYKAYGKNKWVIEKLGAKLERFNQQGRLLYLTFDVTLKEYAAR